VPPARDRLRIGVRRPAATSFLPLPKSRSPSGVWSFQTTAIHRTCAMATLHRRSARNGRGNMAIEGLRERRHPDVSFRGRGPFRRAGQPSRLVIRLLIDRIGRWKDAVIDRAGFAERWWVTLAAAVTAAPAGRHRMPGKSLRWSRTIQRHFTSTLMLPISTPSREQWWLAGRRQPRVCIGTPPA